MRFVLPALLLAAAPAAVDAKARCCFCEALADEGAEIAQTYVVGGNMRFDSPATAPIVRQVLNEQRMRLAALFPKLD